MKSYVAYLRVSTHKQGQSGLGLEAQRAAVGTFTPAAHLLGEFVEVESGKKNERPQLQAAMARAKATGATLLIAKLDRLSRNAGFIFALRDAGVDFVCCDMPDANTLTVGLFAVLAQHETRTHLPAHEGGPRCEESAGRAAGHAGQPHPGGQAQRTGPQPGAGARPCA